MKPIIAINEENYMSLDLNDIHQLDVGKYVVKSINPIYTLDYITCELEVFKKNISKMLTTCNFKNISIAKINGIYLTKTIGKRLIYLDQGKRVELVCPNQKLREKLIGLHLVPNECDLIIDSVFWPAKVEKHIKIKNLIGNRKKGSSFDITDLPIYNVNETNKLHKTIKDQINKLNTDDPFTIDFDELDLSTNQVQSYTIYGYLVLTVFVILNSLLICCLYVQNIRKWLADRTPDQELGFRENFRDFVNSLNLTRKRTFEKTRNKFRDWSRSSIESVRSRSRGRRHRRSSRRNSKLHSMRNSNRNSRRNSLDNNSTYSTDTNNSRITNRVNVGTNTKKLEKLYPQLKDVSDNPKKEKPLHAY